MKIITYTLLMAISLTSCGQQKDDKQNDKSKNNLSAKINYDINNFIFPEAKDITAQNFAEKVTAQIKHYDHEPEYYFRINKQNCFIRIYINDVNICNDYQISNYITPIPIPHILKSGEQKITVKMLPVGNVNNKEPGINDAPPMTKLTADSQVEMSVICIDQKSNKSFNNTRVLAVQTSPKEAEGKETYEFSFTFKAKVPYTFEGWTKGQDLRKLDQVLIKNKALEFYTMLGQIYLNKDLNSILKLDYPSASRIWTSSFGTKQHVENEMTAYKTFVINTSYTIKPFNSYKIEYMGDGKLLLLICDDDRGHSVLQVGSEWDGNINFYKSDIILYLPEGRNLEEGFMMWK